MRAGALAAVALALASAQAGAHDSWLSPARTPAPRGDTAFELSTGNRFPLQESGSPLESLAQSACVDGAGRAVDFKPEQANMQYMALRARRPAGPAQPLSCWIELKPFSFEMQLRLVPVYFAEIRASAALRDTWAQLAARGLPWLETFSKYARIEAVEPPGATPAQRAAVRKPAGLALEIVLLGDKPVAVGEELEFQVLRDGQPLAGLPVELVTERSPLGVWKESDAQGKLRVNLPFGGRWLVRTTDLRLSTQDPTRWESRFATLAIETASR